MKKRDGREGKRWKGGKLKEEGEDAPADSACESFLSMLKNASAPAAPRNAAAKTKQNRMTRNELHVLLTVSPRRSRLTCQHQHQHDTASTHAYGEDPRDRVAPHAPMRAI